MKIRELYIKNFGKFTERRFLLDEGIHIFYGENEYGKSTIYAFIKAMLFGLERGRGRAALNDAFSRYEPWENPNYYAGVMRFESGGKCFRLERTFDRYTKSASLACEDDGEELSVEDGDLEMLLGGMTAEAFESTIAIGQLMAKPGQELAEALKNYAANYYETGSSTVDLGGALEQLKQRRKSVQQEIKLLTEEQELKSERVRQECRYVSEDAEKLRLELEENQEKLDALEKELARISQSGGADQDETDGNRADRNRSNRDRADGNQTVRDEYGKEPGENTGEYSGRNMLSIGALGIIAGAAGHAWSAFAGSGASSIGGGAISVMSWIFLVLGILLVCAGTAKMIKQKRFSNNQRGHAEIPENPQDVPLQREMDTDCRKLQWENQRIKAEWKEKQVRFQNLQEQLAELGIPDNKLKSLTDTEAALQLAEEKLLYAARNMVQGFGDVLNKKASVILGAVTNGRYTKLLIDEQLTMTLFEDGRRIPVDRVSGGTIEQVYFALRMAAAEILYEEPLPVIFDEAFAFYDEKRLKSTLKWLSEQQRQVIIFTCQKRELHSHSV